MRILLALALSLTTTFHFQSRADEPGPFDADASVSTVIPDLPRLDVPSACVRWLLGLPVVNEPYSRAMLRLNYEVHRINRGMRTDPSVWAVGAAEYFEGHFNRARDRELSRLTFVEKVELIARLLNYDDLFIPPPRQQGKWDNPWRVNGTLAAESPGTAKVKPNEALNSREILDILDEPLAWHLLRQRQTIALTDRLLAITNEHPTLFAPAFRAAAVPLGLESGERAIHVMQILGRMCLIPGVRPAARRLVIDEVIGTLSRTVAANDRRRTELGWGKQPRMTNLAGTINFLRIRMERQNTLIKAAITGLKLLREHEINQGD